MSKVLARPLWANGKLYEKGEKVPSGVKAPKSAKGAAPEPEVKKQEEPKTLSDITGK